MDAAIDVLLSRLRPVTSGNLLTYLFYPGCIPNERLRIEIEAAKAAFWDTLGDDGIDEPSKDDINKLVDNDFAKLQFRITKRDTLLHGDGIDLTPHTDTVLDAAVEIREQTGSPFTQWPKVPDIGKMSLQHNAEVSLLGELSAAISNERASATFACGGKVPITGH